MIHEESRLTCDSTTDVETRHTTCDKHDPHHGPDRPGGQPVCRRLARHFQFGADHFQLAGALERLPLRGVEQRDCGVVALDLSNIGGRLALDRGRQRQRDHLAGND